MTNISNYGYAGNPNDNTWTGTFSTDNELFLRIFGGEVLAAYEKAIEVSPRIMQRTISAGKSVQFPIHGRALARHHVPGQDILDKTNKSTNTYVDASGDGTGAGRPIAYQASDVPYLSNLGAEQKTILINDLMLASVFIDDLEEAKAHYDLRSTYTSELGKALARRADNLAVRALVGAASGTGVGPLRGGQAVYDANMAVQADVAASSIIGAIQKLDEYDVPTDERFCVLPPSMYYLLLRAAGGIGPDQSYAALLSRDYSMGNGDFAEGRVLMVAGCPVIVTNNGGFGIDMSTAEDGQYNTELRVNMANIVGVVAHKSAAGMAKLKDLQVESEYMIQNQGNLFVAKMAAGIAPLRTDAAVNLIKTAAP